MRDIRECALLAFEVFNIKKIPILAKEKEEQHKIPIATIPDNSKNVFFDLDLSKNSEIIQVAPVQIRSG